MKKELKKKILELLTNGKNIVFEYTGYCEFSLSIDKINIDNNDKIFEEIEDWVASEWWLHWQSKEDLLQYSHMGTFRFEDNEIYIDIDYWSYPEQFEDECYLHFDEYDFSEELIEKMQKNYNDVDFGQISYQFEYEDGIFTSFKVQYLTDGDYVDLSFNDEEIEKIKLMVKQEIESRDFIISYEVDNKINISCQGDVYHTGGVSFDVNVVSSVIFRLRDIEEYYHKYEQEEDN